MPQAWRSDPVVTAAPKTAWKADPAARRDSAGDAVSGVMDGLKEAIKAIPSAVRHPLDSAYQMFEASKDQYEKAVKAAGPGRDNKGDVAGFIQHAVGMFPVLGPMASNLLDAADSGADSYEVGKRAGNLLSLKAIPLATEGIIKTGVAVAPVTGAVIKGAAGGVRDAVKSVPVELSKYGVDMDFNMPAGKVVAGAGIGGTTAAAMGLPHGLGAAIGGAAPIVAGVIKGARAGLEAFRGGGSSLVTALDKMAQRAGFEDFASVPAEVKPLIQNAFEAEADRLAQTPPTVTPAPAGVTSSGPVRPPVATAAQMMREAGTFRPTETFVPGGALRPPVRTPAAAPASPVEPVAPAEMPALQQITEWLASRDGGTASRFTDPVVSEAPITKQTLGDIMDRLMRNRKVPAEVPAATVPAEVPPAAVPEIVPPAAVETPVVPRATPAPSAAGTPITAATLMEEATKPTGKKVPPFDWNDEAQYKEYQKALVEDSNIYGNNRTTMADRVTRFMKKNGIEPTDSGIVRALEQSAEDIAVSPTTGLKRPSFNAADHEVLFDMIKDRLETPTVGEAAPVAAAQPPAAAKGKAEIAARIDQIDAELSAGMEDAMRTNRPPSDYEKALGAEKRQLQGKPVASTGGVPAIRSGDFYKVTGENAKQIARELGLTVMQENGSPMIGIPAHSFDGAVQSLKLKGISLQDATKAAKVPKPPMTAKKVKPDPVKIISKETNPEHEFYKQFSDDGPVDHIKEMADNRAEAAQIRQLIGKEKAAEIGLEAVREAGAKLEKGKWVWEYDGMPVTNADAAKIRDTFGVRALLEHGRKAKK